MERREKDLSAKMEQDAERLRVQRADQEESIRVKENALVQKSKNLDERTKAAEAKFQDDIREIHNAKEAVTAREEKVARLESAIRRQQETERLAREKAIQEETILLCPVARVHRESSRILK
jgi:hypothetical protein